MREDKKLAATSGSAIGVSAIASFIGLCCIGPGPLHCSGVSGSIAMARWQPARPYLLTSAVIMLAWAFWRVYGPPRKKLCATGICPAQPSLWLQGALWSRPVACRTRLFCRAIAMVAC